MLSITPIASSFKDNNGFVFTQNNLFYRLVAPSYFIDYDLLMSSGLYQQLTDAQRLITHTEISNTEFKTASDNKILLPTQLPFISYPYEWCFNMWQDAAIVTLKIALQSLKYGMILKDATPFNIQFYNGRPVFIDTLSFTKYEPGSPWVAYHQFCECILAPLLLMHYNNADMGKLFLIYPNGIPLNAVKSLLPIKAKLNLQVYLHIWLQSTITDTTNKTPTSAAIKKLPLHKLQLLLNGLLNMIANLKPKKNNSTWQSYYNNTILSTAYLQAKTEIFNKFTNSINFKSVIDLGANDGHFSLLLKDKASHIIATDFDNNCVTKLYKEIRLQKIKNIVPILSTLNAPSPSIGWQNEERQSLTQRLKADLVLALALVHHLAIADNIPLQNIAIWLHNMCTYLIIEFVPKTDEKVQQLLMHRIDIFENYTLNNFKTIFKNYFEIIAEEKIPSTERILFLMKKR